MLKIKIKPRSLQKDSYWVIAQVYPPKNGKYLTDVISSGKLRTVCVQQFMYIIILMLHLICCAIPKYSVVPVFTCFGFLW